MYNIDENKRKGDWMLTNYYYYQTILDNIEEGDIVVYCLPDRDETTYWMVMETDFEDNTIYGRQVEHNCIKTFSYVPENEAYQSRWISIADLELRATVELNMYELRQPVRNIAETYEEEQEELQEEVREETYIDPDTAVYHVEYSLDYARGLSLKEISSSEIIDFEGIIVSKDRTWIFKTLMGYVIIPYESIIHMHLVY